MLFRSNPNRGSGPQARHPAGTYQSDKGDCPCLLYTSHADPEPCLRAGGKDERRHRGCVSSAACTGALVAMLDYGTQADILKGNLLGYKGAIFENLMADFLCKSGQKLYYLHKDSGLELDFLVRFKGECVILEIKAKTGKSKSMTTVLKNKDVYHVKNAIKLGQYNVGREGDILTIPLYMGFLVNDKLADVIIPDVDVNLLNV